MAGKKRVPRTMGLMGRKSASSRKRVTKPKVRRDGVTPEVVKAFQLPSVGRIVHVHDGGGATTAGIITHVHGHPAEGIVDLTVFPRKEAPAVRSFVGFGHMADQWSWPERV